MNKFLLEHSQPICIAYGCSHTRMVELSSYDSLTWKPENIYWLAHV